MAAPSGKVLHFVLTLTGSQQTLDEVLTGSGYTDREILLEQLWLQADEANGNPVYLGGSVQAVSSSAWGVRIPKATSSVPEPPLLIYQSTPAGGARKLSAWRVLGTNAEKLHLTCLVL